MKRLFALLAIVPLVLGTAREATAPSTTPCQGTFIATVVRQNGETRLRIVLNDPHRYIPKTTTLDLLITGGQELPEGLVFQGEPTKVDVEKIDTWVPLVPDSYHCSGREN